MFGIKDRPFTVIILLVFNAYLCPDLYPLLCLVILRSGPFAHEAQKRHVRLAACHGHAARHKLALGEFGRLKNHGSEFHTVAFFAGSLGICFSALFKRSTISTVVTYGVLIAVVAGTYFINKFSLSLSSMNISNSVAAYGFGENVVKPSSGNVIYLLLLNPAATFYTIINGQMGGSTPTAKMAGYFGMQSTGFVMKNWIIISIVIQLAIAALMIWAAIKAVEPVKRRRRQKKAAKKGD